MNVCMMWRGRRNNCLVESSPQRCAMCIVWAVEFVCTSCCISIICCVVKLPRVRCARELLSCTLRAVNAQWKQINLGEPCARHDWNVNATSQRHCWYLTTYCELRRHFVLLPETRTRYKVAVDLCRIEIWMELINDCRLGNSRHLGLLRMVL